ncbi:MAG: 4-hydroxy-3-methylbut-2-enyl diphosphate reductase [Planctomycetaceae bacterium]|jgi:4-hydroxy-3-methylbut-2-enyl diphosphate reductase|nr:4-hydroxy-3-methylbut-2-enyl diphosphate reductase [Planctomycetaceae bacterium]
MKIVLAQPRGFCSGVKKAVQLLESALAQVAGTSPPTSIYVYHQIVHNTYIVEDFQRRGVIFVDSLDEVPDGSLLLFSAHGVAPRIRLEAAKQHLKTIDATCSLVDNAHQLARHYADEGYKIILIGHRGHDEITGIQGEAPEAIYVVENEKEIEALDFPPGEKLAYLTQTTLSSAETQKQIDLLTSRFPQIQGQAKSNICSATQSRQDAVRQLSAGADAVLIIGSKNSSNSRRLKEVAESIGLPAYLTDRPEDIPIDSFDTGDTVLITAGASAPEHLVKSCVALLQQHFGAVTDAVS